VVTGGLFSSFLRTRCLDDGLFIHCELDAQ